MKKERSQYIPFAFCNGARAVKEAYEAGVNGGEAGLVVFDQFLELRKNCSATFKVSV